MIIATGAAIRSGVYSLSDRGWDALRSQREVRPAPVPAPLHRCPRRPGAGGVVPEDMKPATTPREILGRSMRGASWKTWSGLQQKTGQNSWIRTVCGPRLISGIKTSD